MCGIYGVTSKNESIVKKMIDNCSHRGPDGQKTISNEDVTLGHNLLSITSSPSEGVQPFYSEINSNMLTYNGEIFNYVELIKKFSNRFKPKTSCDTELLFWLLNNFSYEEVVCNLIDSMHAFAFYNSDKKELVLSRDHVGIKPLYFSVGNGGLIFCSEIKGMIEFVYNSKKINKNALSMIAKIGTNPTRDTLFTGIYKILPGETLIYDLSNKKIKNTFSSIVLPKSNIKFNKEEFIYQVNTAVTNSTLGNKEFGIFLSGGLDSSLITYELQKNLTKLNTFTNVMNPNATIGDEDLNEDAYIAAKFSKEIKSNHTEIEITPSTIIDYWEDALKFIEEPMYNWELPMVYFTNQYLSHKNITITMSGDIGDEILGGYHGYFLFNSLNKQIELENRKITWKKFLRMWMNKYKNPLQLRLNIGDEDLLNILEKKLPQSLWNPADLGNTAMALDCVTTVSENYFKRNDRFGMAFSMEGRFPLSSKKLMEYCLGIHSNEKYGDSSSLNKVPIRTSYNHKIPNYVFSKKKTGWSSPFTLWLKNNKLLNDKFRKSLKKETGIDSLFTPINIEDKFSSNIVEDRKQLIIEWMMKTWANQYDMHN